jgi:tetratricopeptide (TPR) repeat protein
MVCEVCGTRNVAGEARCIRCGARMETPTPSPEPVPARDLSPGERLATEAREQLAAGDSRAALVSAQRAAVMEPNTLLCRLVLGEAYLQMDAPDDALREFRRAAELDPECAEARDKAELARRRLTHSHEAESAGAGDWRAFLLARKQIVSVVAGAIAGLLVFAVGAGAIVSRTSPAAQTERAYRQQMLLGRQQYQAGRYEDAANAFEQALRVKPDSQEARRRLQDALAVAGLAPQPAAARPAATGQQVAAVGPLNDYSPMLPRWVGPLPRAAQPARPTSDVLPPPPIPVPDDQSPPPLTTLPTLPPPVLQEPDSADHVTGPARNDTSTGTDIGVEATDSAEPGATEPTPPAQQSKPGRIVIQRHGPAPPTTGQPPASRPTGPDGDALRAEADHLRSAGNASAAAQKYSEAASRYREEAARGGPGAATKSSAAASCDRARQLCETQGH